MSTKTPVKIMLGTHQIGDATQSPGIIHFDSEEEVRLLLDTFRNRGYEELDTASNYLGSEYRLGRADAPSQFKIHTKVKSGQPGDLEPEKVKQSIENSLRDLQVSTVETFFLHLPDRQTPIAQTAKVMDEAFQEGKFRKLGLSNYSPAEVREYLDICDWEGYVKPSVYQGHYNLVVRGGEKELFPILRANGMSFVAFSPAAGGILSGHADTSRRWKDDNLIGSIYTSIYGNSSVSAAIEKVRSLAAQHDVSAHAAAVRWAAFHSILDGKYGDGLIIGMSSIAQLNKTLDSIEEGPLPADLAESIGAVHATLGDNEPPFCI